MGPRGGLFGVAAVVSGGCSARARARARARSGSQSGRPSVRALGRVAPSRGGIAVPQPSFPRLSAAPLVSSTRKGGNVLYSTQGSYQRSRQQGICCWRDPGGGAGAARGAPSVVSCEFWCRRLRGHWEPAPLVVRGFVVEPRQMSSVETGLRGQRQARAMTHYISAKPRGRMSCRGAGWRCAVQSSARRVPRTAAVPLHFEQRQAAIRIRAAERALQ